MFNHALAYVLSTLAAPKRDERGATAVEYGMLVALIAAVLVTTILLLGGQIKTAFTDITTALTTATTP